MTKEEARIIVLEAALEQAQYTVGFLHGCLTEPKHFKYGYPKQTTDRLAKWGELVPLRDTCPHSGPTEGCELCVESQKRRRQLHEAEEVLKTPEQTNAKD